MPLSQLQGLTPLGGNSNYGTGQPPSADGTDPNNPNKQASQNTQAPPAAPSSSQGSASPGSAPTFAQLQAQGRARPAPPVSGQQLGNQANQAASQALQNPSAYGAPQVQQSIDALNQNLATQDQLGKQSIDQTMAARGLYDSTATGQKYGMLEQQESAQRAQLAATLSQQAATTYGQDRSTAIQNALAASNQQFNQGLSQQQLQLQQALGYGNLGVSQQQANTQQAGTLGNLQLGQQQLAQQGSQFGQNLALQSALGYGNLGVQQQQANTQQAGTLGNLNLGQQQITNQAGQFGQTFGLQQLQNQQQYGLQQGQLTGTYNGQQTLAGLQNSQQYGLNQQALAQQQQYQMGQLGLGQNQINASLINEQRQTLGNLAYAGLQNGTAPSQDWMNFLLSSQGMGSTNYGSTNYGGQSYGGQSYGGPSYQTYGTPSSGTSGSSVQNALGYGSGAGLTGSPYGSSYNNYNPYGNTVGAYNAYPSATGGQTNTINFGGNQYTPQQFQQFQQSNPQLFGSTTGQSNNQFFAQNQQQQAAYRQMYGRYYQTGNFPTSSGASQSGAPSGPTQMQQSRQSTPFQQGSWTGDGGLTITNSDPNNPGSAYLTYNGQQYRVAGTSAAGSPGPTGQSQPVAGKDFYYLQDANGNVIQGPPIGSEYSQFMTAAQANGGY